MSSERRVLPDAARGKWYERRKRFLDLVMGGVGAVVLMPLFIVVAVAVKLSSPGPVFYGGERTGRFGRPFRVWKFRTMVEGADRGAGTTSRRDPRVTRIGRFLRRHKLDELPQLFNVIQGSMSLVGPRPELARYTEQYKGEELLILQVKPGITDLASLEFSNLDDLIPDDDPDAAFQANVLEEKNRLRVQYVLQRSTTFDLILVFRTLQRVLALR